MSVTNNEGQGLLFVAPDEMAASAVHFRPEDNYTNKDTRKKHTYEFVRCDNTVVNLDAATRGLGNNSCGPDVMDKYELKAANTAFRFFIIPLKAGNDVAAIARVDMPVCQPVSCERQSNGRIKMSTPTKNATIYYSINRGDYQKYTDPLIQNDACTINTYCTGENLMDSPVMTYDFDLYINKSAWKLVSADSQHSGNEARLAFDGRNDTFWHTEWGSVEPPCPHTIVIDMASEYKVTAITYLSRQDGSQNGMVKNFEVYLSNDGSTWGSPVVSGQFKNTTSQQVTKLTTPTTGRYLKFVAKSEINGNAWTSAAEIGIQAESDHTTIWQVETDKQQNTAVVYDLNGRRMNGHLAQQPKGIYISNGRKIVK